MPNKTRYLILPDRMYLIKLDTGEEIEVSGLDLIQIGVNINSVNKLKESLQELEEMGKAWF